MEQMKEWIDERYETTKRIVEEKRYESIQRTLNENNSKED